MTAFNLIQREVQRFAHHAGLVFRVDVHSFAQVAFRDAVEDGHGFAQRGSNASAGKPANNHNDNENSTAERNQNFSSRLDAAAGV
jgi:hypothetical protein